MVVDNPFIRPYFLKKGALLAQVYIDMVIGFPNHLPYEGM